MIPQRTYRAFVIASAIIGAGVALVAILTQRPPSPVPTFIFSSVILALLCLVVLSSIWPWLVRWSRLSTRAAALTFGTAAAVVVSIAVFWRITGGMRFGGAVNPQADYSTAPLLACLGTWVVATAFAFLGLTLWRRRGP